MMIAAITPDQRTAFVLLYIVHFANENKVVAAGHFLVKRASECNHYSTDERNVSPTSCPLDARKTVVLVPVGKARRQLLLVLAQDVDRKRLICGQILQKTRVAIDTGQHQRRVERHRGKRAHGHPIR